MKNEKQIALQMDDLADGNEDGNRQDTLFFIFQSSFFS